MKKKTSFLIILLVILMCLAVLYYTVFPKSTRLDSMTTEEKIGQLVMFGIDGQALNDEAIKLIKDYHVGGIILTGKNIANTEQLVELNNQIKTINKKQNNTPIFIATDEEGGLITRMPPEIKNLPSSYVIGNEKSSSLATEVGRAIGERVTFFGFNMTMAPVLDVNSNPRNPVIGKRSFGNDANLVADIGVSEMKGISSVNIIPVIKHFPGHGDTNADSHKGLPIVKHDLNRLKETELLPFKKAIDEDASMIMVAHILLPKLDPAFPSSLSHTVISDLLRDSMKYNGVVITDDMTMGAISKNHDIGEAAIISVKAGADIILVNHGNKNREKVIKSLTDAVSNGEISEKRLNESVTRILKLKGEYELADKTIKGPFNIEEINKSTDSIMKQISGN